MTIQLAQKTPTAGGGNLSSRRLSFSDASRVRYLAEREWSPQDVCRMMGIDGATLLVELGTGFYTDEFVSEFIARAAWS